MPGDEYAKNFLMSDITRSFSFCILITYGIQNREHSVCISSLCPLFWFVRTFFIAFHSLARECQRKLLRAFCSVCASPRCYFWQDVYFFSLLSLFLCSVSLQFSWLMFQAIYFLFPLTVFSYPFLYSSLVPLLFCISSVVLNSDSLPWNVTSWNCVLSWQRY